MKYDQKKWNEGNDMGEFKFRDQMLDDLLETKHLKGKKISELHEIFGDFKVGSYDDKPEIYFNIIKEYGAEDPIYTKDLILELDNDSVVKNVRVVEWKK